MKYSVYPIGNPALNIGKNPYIDNLIDAIESSGNVVVNKSKFTSNGVFSLFQYLLVSDGFVFNWLESLGEKRFGKLQSLFLPLFLVLLRLLRKRVIVIFHNKHAHNNDDIFSKYNVLCSVLFSSVIITHANEGKKYIINKFRRLIKVDKVRFINHPVYSNEMFSCNSDVIIYDYIIWGAISEYKGIYEFLEFVKKNNKLQKKKILICGKVVSKDFLNRLLSLKLENVEIIDKFMDEKNLLHYFSLSREILFVYSGSSVLSSGALIKSLNYGKPIIGPRIGAFEDLESQKLIRCYKSYLEIGSISLFDENRIINFLNHNLWSRLIIEILK